MDQYVPRIQETLRKAGYPDFGKNFVATLNFNFGGKMVPDQPVNAVTQPQAQYMFFNETKDSGFILENSALSFQTSNYQTFDVFLSALMVGIRTVHINAELQYFERLGVRYLDAILPRPNEDVSAYLTQNVLGLYGQFNDRKLVHAISETRSQCNENELMSRAIIIRQDQVGEVAFPADMGGQVVKLMEKFQKVSGVYGLMDTDSAHTSRGPFDLGQIEKRFVSLHSMIWQSFALMVTPHALTVWE